MIDEKKLIGDIKAECEINAGGLYVNEIIGVIHDQPKVGEWILVSERLPGDGDDYVYPKCLVTIENGDVCLGVYRHCDKEWLTRMSAGETVYSNIHDVLAWMPLPEPYKGE